MVDALQKHLNDTEEQALPLLMCSFTKLHTMHSFPEDKQRNECSKWLRSFFFKLGNLSLKYCSGSTCHFTVLTCQRHLKHYTGHKEQFIISQSEAYAGSTSVKGLCCGCGDCCDWHSLREALLKKMVLQTTESGEAGPEVTHLLNHCNLSIFSPICTPPFDINSALVTLMERIEAY
ncbi:uncharacterized protein V6R79_015255 [Siganus canaliculatus]